MTDDDSFVSMVLHEETMRDIPGEIAPPEDINWDDLTPVQQFYYGKCIFITGATGTIGKILLEKILRCCPGVGVIYILMRPKKGFDVEERLEKLLDTEVFDSAKEKIPNLKNKIRVIFGDLEHPGLGISDADVEELKHNVKIAFHVAADVRFDNPLRLAAQLNICGTKEVLKLLKQFPKLQAFVYVSTAFVHREPDFTIPEHITRMRMTPAQFLSALEWLDDECLELITPILTREKGNTYLFSKALAENVILEENGNLPTAVVRPGLIMPTYKEPIPGYCDTIQGVQGMFIAVAKGFLRTMYSFPGLKLNLVPVDTVVNTLVTTAWYVGTRKPDGIFVVNSVLDYDKLPSFEEGLSKQLMKKRDDYPLVNLYRYPDFTFHHTLLFYHIHAFFDHHIPAVVGDTLLFIFTGKPIMRKLYNRINFMIGEFVKHGRYPWIGSKKNYKNIMNTLSKEDSEIFFMNMDDMDWSKYIDDMLLVGRRIIAKENPSNIPYAKKKAKVWWFVTTFFKWCVILYVFNYLLAALFPDNIFSKHAWHG